MPASATSRVNMAKGQLITNEVLDGPLLDAMTSVPREKCVPVVFAGSAYVDDDLEVAPGRYLPAPLTFARLVQLADIQPGDSVLDVSALYGYSTAVLSRLCARVTGVETNADMVAAAKRNLASFSAENASVVQADRLDAGYLSGGPYDVILIEGAVACRPSELLSQLKPGGRLIAAEMKNQRPGSPEGLCRLVEFLNRDGTVLRKEALEVNVPLVPGFEAKQVFSFQ